MLPSTHNLTVRPAHPGDAIQIAVDLREADRVELEASTYQQPEKAIRNSIRMSAACWTAEYKGVPVAVFGVTPVNMLEGIGSPWLLATADCDRLIVQFVRQTRVYIPIMLSLFPRLENLVDARNAKSIRWLKRLGFQIRDAKPHPYSGAPFHPFDMERPE